MAVTTLDFDTILSKDDLASKLSDTYHKWKQARDVKEEQWKELRNYVYATDTTTTSNSKLPWKNKTTTPKLTQIRDNLYANYMASMFPKRKWLRWEGNSKDDNSIQKKNVIESYMFHAVEQPQFRNEISKLVYDFIDFGNAFAMPVWIDGRVEGDSKTKHGYVGPGLKRISPYDIVFNPTAPSFKESPKFIRSLTTMGNVKKVLEGLYPDASDREIAQGVFDYLSEIRTSVNNLGAKWESKDQGLRVDGFGSFQDYLTDGSIELLYFYGDIYDDEKRELQRNRLVVIADRHKVIYNKEELSIFETAPIYHVGWRPRQDNLWAMGPLDNLVGMQYRIDHLENLKADVFDLIAFPPLKIKGYVQDFVWGPFAKILVGDDGDVEVMSPDVQALNANMEIGVLEQKMEEMAGSPKEAMGFRTPGEKTMYEVQRLENAASRTFQTKISEFEMHLIEEGMNGMLELARRNAGNSVIKTIEPEFGSEIWLTISPEDIAGNGRIRPLAARHFAENAQMIQNINTFFGSPFGQDPAIRRHFKSFDLAKLVTELLQLEERDLLEKDVGIAEQLEAQALMNAGSENNFVQAQTPGITETMTEEVPPPNASPAEAPVSGMDEALA